MKEILFALSGVLLFGMASVARAEDKVVSETLLKELQALTSEMLAEAKKEGVQPPPNVTAEQLQAQAVEILKPTIMVTADEEARFKKGEFDDEANNKRMDLYPKLYADLNIELPKALVILLDAHKSGKLAGVRLELAVRINQTTAEKMRKAANKK